ncbi:phosphopantothenoylcysteine decarboxylase subunit VHS3-like [Argentina anserina]|uniref:phosphopantothenoylcysteine decarboxylase subunit VHS3-like n=1 Tax=Argentina anserina TaxID=57926 RepID=UPI0021761E98|nr:phosphopantothenoylcysteine decarboxylase subunit VHS3-like [Potentilla anserina]
MEMLSKSNCAADFDSFDYSLLESLVAETAILADKSLLLLFLLVLSSVNKKNVLLDSVTTDQRFLTSDLNKVKEPDAENSDAGEAEGDNDSDNGDEDEDDGNDSEEDSDDDEEDSDDELVATGYGESDDEDEDSDEDEDDNSDEDGDDDDSEDEDDEEQYKLPSQRKK